MSHNDSTRRLDLGPVEDTDPYGTTQQQASDTKGTACPYDRPQKAQKKKSKSDAPKTAEELTSPDAAGEDGANITVDEVSSTGKAKKGGKGTAHSAVEAVEAETTKFAKLLGKAGAMLHSGSRALGGEGGEDKKLKMI